MKLLSLIIIGLIILSGCSKSPENIKYGLDCCEYCKMLITEKNYGAELVTQKGKIFKYDSIECLAAHHEKIGTSEIHSMWVINYLSPNDLLNINEAKFLLSEELRSPMGLNLCSFNNDGELNKIKSQFGGRKITWEELIKYVSTQWN